MANFVLVPEEDYEQLQEARKELARLQESLDRIFSKSGRIEIEPSVIGGTGTTGATGTNDDERQQQYPIGRKTNEYSYADVAWKEIDADQFTLDEGWEAVKDLVVTSSERARDSFRRSLDTDDRFARVATGGSEIVFRRRDPSQIELEG